MRWLPSTFLVAALALAGCGDRSGQAPARPASGSTVAIKVTPAKGLVDDRLDIAITGLPSQRVITVAAATQAPDGLTWRSRAVFRSDAGGRLDLATQAPIAGDYRGADAMGLFWAAAPDASGKGERVFFDVSNAEKPIVTRLGVTDGPVMLATMTVERAYAAPEVIGMRAGNGVHGVLYAPNDGKRHPAVLVIGGSDGGYGDQGLSRLLASHGFAALSIAYFGDKGLPASLERIPMEDFTDALTWLRRQPTVDARFVAIYGESRGSEPALWAAAYTRTVNAVVARSPSFVLWGGISANHLPGTVAWTWEGRALPYVPNRLGPGFLLRALGDRAIRTPVRQTPLFLRNLKEFGDTTRAEIAVERINGPVLLLAGKDDQVWPSALMAERIMGRLGRFHHPYSDRLVAYKETGHPIPYAYLPIAGDRRHARFAVGGTVEGTSEAMRDAWPSMLSFLLDAAAQRGAWPD